MSEDGSGRNRKPRLLTCQNAKTALIRAADTAGTKPIQHMAKIFGLISCFK